MLDEEQVTQNMNRRRFMQVSAASVSGVMASLALAPYVGASPASTHKGKKKPPKGGGGGGNDTLVPVRRYYNYNTGYHFFTIHPGNVADLLNGFTLEASAAFYVPISAKYQGYSTEKFYCYTDAVSGNPHDNPNDSVDYLFTTHPDDEAIRYSAFPENDLGYIFPIARTKRPDSSVPLYRFTNGSEHFYTANSSEASTLKLPGSGYRFEFIVGYVFAGH